MPLLTRRLAHSRRIELMPAGSLPMARNQHARPLRIALVTENYLLPTNHNNVAYSAGIRFMGEKLTTDLALFNTVGSQIIGVPYVDFVFKF
jgi:hypothetical protein